MNIPLVDKNGVSIKQGDIVIHGDVGARYVVLNGFEMARGETMVQIAPMTGQAWMYVKEVDITKDLENEKNN